MKIIEKDHNFFQFQKSNIITSVLTRILLIILSRMLTCQFDHQTTVHTKTYYPTKTGKRQYSDSRADQTLSSYSFMPRERLEIKQFNFLDYSTTETPLVNEPKTSFVILRHTPDFVERNIYQNEWWVMRFWHNYFGILDPQCSSTLYMFSFINILI